MNDATILGLLSNLSWREPLWLCLAGVPLLLRWLPMARRAMQRQPLTRYAEPQLLPWVTAQRPASMRQTLFSKNSAYATAWVLFAIAASGPRLPLIVPGDTQPVQRNIMLLVDMSRSMQVSDIGATRLRRARIEIDELLQRARHARIGIIVFAARPHLYVPLTTDFTAVRNYLQNLDRLQLPTEGSQPESALQMAIAELQGRQEPSAIVLFSDGDFTQAVTAAGDTKPLAQTVSAGNIPVYALGLGSSEGEAIPLPGGEWLRYQGQAVISRLNEEALRRFIAANDNIAATTAAQHYSTARDDEGDWQRLYNQGIAKLGKDQHQTIDHKRHNWRELYPWALFPAIVLLWSALLPWRITPRQHLPRTLAMTGTALILGLLFLLPPPIAQAADASDTHFAADMGHAYQQYAAGHFDEAIQRYKAIPGYSGRLGEGASRYKNADYGGAVAQFAQAVLSANSDAERAVALFNLGNSYFQIGNYPSAIASFRDALLYDPQSKPAQHNLAFSRALKKVVDQQGQRASRMGSGPQLAPARNNINTQESGSMAIDESESTLERELPLPELADLSTTALQALIDKGLQQIRLAASAAAAKNIAEQQKTKLALIDARLRMLQLQDQQALLWKRLFEMEEGFPAALESPRTVPGVAPW